MLPTLIQLGPLAITSLGFCLFLAFFTAAFLIWQKGREENFDPEPLMDSVVLTTLTALVGARIVFLLFSRQSLTFFFNLFKVPGFSYFGAFWFGFFFLVYFCQRQKWNFFKLLEVYIFGLLPAQILIRFGNFLDGSFYGRETSLPWGIKFPGLDQPVHPLNLYEIFFLLGLYYLVRRLERQYRLFDWYKDKRGEAQAGFLFLVYLLGYNLFRFLLEFLHLSSLYFKGLAWEQWWSAATVVTGLVLFYARSGNRKQEMVVFFQEFLGQIFKKRSGPKLEVLKPPTFLPGRPKKKTSPFHFKAGMEAKEIQELQ